MLTTRLCLQIYCNAICYLGKSKLFFEGGGEQKQRYRAWSAFDSAFHDICRAFECISKFVHMLFLCKCYGLTTMNHPLSS